MAHIVPPANLSLAQIEQVELASMRIVYQSLYDFAETAAYIFANSPDDLIEVAEDCTREAMDRAPGFPLQRRIFGRTDYKRATYAFLPDLAVKQALLVDSKAEKTGNVARMQMSQTTMDVIYERQGQVIREPAGLPIDMTLHGELHLITTIFAHYEYAESHGTRALTKIRIAALPNGKLARHYIPGPRETIWLVGPHSPPRSEAFRARLSFARLKTKAAWRVQDIAFQLDPSTEKTSVISS